MARFRSFAALPAALAVGLLLLAGCTSPSEPVTTTTTTTTTTKPAATTGPSTPSAPGKPEVKPSASTTPAKPVTTSSNPVVPPSAPVVELKPGKISGSEETSAMFDNFTAYVRAVDGQVVATDRLNWNNPVTLKAGARKLTVVFIRGVFTATANVTLQVRPEGVYQLKFATDAQLFGKNSFCEFWIEETKSGVKAVEPMRVPLVRVEKSG